MKVPMTHGGPDEQGVPMHDFSTNANAAGPCPGALAALREADAAHYPDPRSTALRLRVRLGKPGVYTLNACAGAPVAGDVQRAVRLAARVVAASAAVAALAILLLAVSCGP